MGQGPGRTKKNNGNIWPWPVPDRVEQQEEGLGQHIWLRLLETTDVHGHLLAYDYASDTKVDGFGLEKVAGHIKKMRAEATNTFLFENGDFLQGSPLTDITIRPENGWSGPNPVVTAMNHLKYDAATLGNHDFNFGLDWLQTALKEAAFPVICANIMTQKHSTDPTKDVTLFPPYQILDCALTDNGGNTQRIRIGIIGLLPPQILQWDRDHLFGRLEARDMLEAAQAYVPAMKKDGAEIILALAHTGVGQGEMSPGQENAGLALADVSGIDAVMTGHVHQVFPNPNVTSADPGVSFSNGTLAGKPAVMAGFRGSHLGVIDLLLQPTATRWQVVGHKVKAHAVSETASTADPKLAEIVATAHQTTLRQNNVAVGVSSVPVHSYLSQFRPDPGQQLIMACKRDALAAVLKESEHASLPVLSASAPYKTGGPAGPEFYTDIPAGPISLRNIASLYPFPNTLVGLRMTSDQLLDWLERSVSCLQQLRRGERRQVYWNPAFVGHAFDTVYGLEYDIDLTQPPRFNHLGELINPGAKRIQNVTHAGRPLASDAAFAVAVKNFRAATLSSLMQDEPNQPHVLFKGTRLIRDLVTEFLSTRDICPPTPAQKMWRFVPVAETSVLLETGPGVLDYPGDLRALGARVGDTTRQGFVQIEIPLNGPQAMSSQDNVAEKHV